MSSITYDPGSSAAVPVYRIGDLTDPRVEPYARMRERDVAKRCDAFLAEGEVVLRTLIGSDSYAIRSLLLAESRVDPLADLLSRLDDSIPVYVLAQAGLDNLVGMHLHRGILALVERPILPRAEDLLEEQEASSIVIGLVGVVNHDNVGGIFRNAAAFGAAAVLLDSVTCDPLYRKAIRVSVGGVFRVPYARVATGEEIVCLLRDHGYECFSLSPSGSENLATLRKDPSSISPSRTALLFGSEGPGLPPSVLAETRTVRIEMEAGFDSLNVSVAAAIALYELGRRIR